MSEMPEKDAQISQREALEGTNSYGVLLLEPVEEPVDGREAYFRRIGTAFMTKGPEKFENGSPFASLSTVHIV